MSDNMSAYFSGVWVYKYVDKEIFGVNVHRVTVSAGMVPGSCLAFGIDGCLPLFYHCQLY